MANAVARTDADATRDGRCCSRRSGTKTASLPAAHSATTPARPLFARSPTHPRTRRSDGACARTDSLARRAPRAAGSDAAAGTRGLRTSTVARVGLRRHPRVESARRAGDRHRRGVRPRRRDAAVSRGDGRATSCARSQSPADRLRSARPTAVNLGWAVDRIVAAAQPPGDGAARYALIEARSRSDSRGRPPHVPRDRRARDAA